MDSAVGRFASATFVEAIAQNATLALFLTDTRLCCTYMNPAAERLTGFSAIEVQRRDEPLDEVVHRGHAESAVSPFSEGLRERVLALRTSAQGEDVFLHEDGHAYPVAFSASPVLEHGSAVGVVIEVRALADERRIARELEEGEARYRFLAETIPVQIWTALPDGHLDYVTTQTARHFGLSVDKLLAEGWLDVVHPEDRQRVIERWVHSLTTGESYEVEFRLRLHDGRYGWHLARAVAQRGPEGQIVRWFGTNTDIDEQREVQRRTQALLDEIALQARESEVSLTRLLRAKEAAEARVAELEARLGAP
ncbi:PAS domain-containing protein [Chondromyces apiculatus]|uniref:histidine kinase n=1 Tax=Chondromyces apiculatus DSM 436 TaxID=1192034 RepID=A0A017TAW3_9BACT|nr:PAS domain S-box protein [Chondromyces apiculatus]EYF05756.1 two-component sensor histidine kinase [Chondromyces apiculatus DSM 436]